MRPRLANRWLVAAMTSMASSDFETIYEDSAAYLGETVRELAIDHASFTQKVRPCDLTVCRATCCHDGVRLSATDAGILGAFIDRTPEIEGSAESYLEQDERGWKTATRAAQPYELANDYPDHFPATRCALLDDLGRCELQKHAVDRGEHAWKYKPLTCWLHPLVIENDGARDARPILRLYATGNDPQRSANYSGFVSCTHCGRADKHGEPASAVFSVELAVLGALGSRNLERELA